METKISPLAASAYLLNLVDLVFTLMAISLGGIELNPLMRIIPVQIIYKLLVVGALILWLSRRPERLARAGLIICTAAYALVDAYHMLVVISFFIYASRFFSLP